MEGATITQNQENIESIDELLAGAREPLEAAKAELETEANAVRERLVQITNQIRRIDKTLATLDPAAAAKKSPSKTVPGTARVSKETINSVFAFLQEHGEGTITEISDALGISATAVSTAIRDMRAANPPVVRLAGRRGSAQLFKPFENNTNETESE